MGAILVDRVCPTSSKLNSIGSNTDFFPYFDECFEPEAYWNETALPQADVAVRTAGVLPASSNKSPTFRQLFPGIEGPRPLQRLAAEVPLTGEPECIILEDVPGSGKTEAALLLAARMIDEGRAEGIYFALPTMATANAMYDRIASCYESLLGTGEKLSLSLAHGASRLNGKCSPYPGYRRLIGSQTLLSNP